jgi:hypothetical protein
MELVGSTHRRHCPISYVYALIDPRDGEIRYVGVANNPQERLIAHITEARCNGFTLKMQWIISLLRNNLRPSIKILKIVARERRLVEEKRYILHFANRGRLLNQESLEPHYRRVPKYRIAKALSSLLLTSKAR